MLYASDMMELHHLVNEPTHKEGHTLDLIVRRQSKVDFVKDVYVDLQISDHYVLSFRVEIVKSPQERKIIPFRKTRSIDTESFMNDVTVQVSKLGSCYNVEDRVNNYNTILSQLLDEYAPEKQHTVTIQHKTPWYSKELHEEKIICRKLEGKWCSTKSEEDQDIFKRQRQKVQNLKGTLKKLALLLSNKRRTIKDSLMQ